MKKNKIKKINKKKAVLFICSFLTILAFTILPTKFFGFRGDIYTWKDIGYALPIYMISSFGFAAWMTWSGVGDNLIEFFANRRKNKKGKE